MFGFKARAVDEVVGPPLTFWPAFAVIALGVSALNIIGVVPVLLGALQDEHRLSAAGIGQTAMLELLSMGISTGLCGAFLKAARMKTIGVFGSIALAALHMATLYASGVGVLVVRAAAGVPEGVLLWITVGMIVRSRTPERWSGVFFTGQTVAQLMLAAAFWLFVLPRFGANGGFMTLGLTTLLGVPIALLAPSRYKALAQAEGLHGAPPPRGWFALLATVVFVSANGAVSVYIEPLAHQAGLTANVARFAVFAGLVAQVMGGTLATLIAGKVRYISVFAVCVIVYLITWSVYGFTNQAWLFVATTSLAGVTTLLISPFLTPMIIEADPTRRAGMQSAGAQILGGAAGPLLGLLLGQRRQRARRLGDGIGGPGARLRHDPGDPYDGQARMIAFEGAAKSFDGGGSFAVDHVDLAVAKGEFRVIVGASGSGKTTLLKLLNRLVEPNAGVIRLDGRSVTEGPAHLLRRKVGYVFQGVGLFPHLTVGENIGITPKLLGWSQDVITQRVDELLDLVALPRAYGARMPTALSGGQRQRIGLARALAAKPEVVLLDEPFGALDAVTRDALGRDYRKIHDDLGLTTVMITHDMMEALLLADRIAVMREGRLIADGSPHDVLTGQTDPYVSELVETPRRQAERVSALAAT